MEELGIKRYVPPKALMPQYTSDTTGANGSLLYSADGIPATPPREFDASGMGLGTKRNTSGEALRPLGNGSADTRFFTAGDAVASTSMEPSIENAQTGPAIYSQYSQMAQAPNLMSAGAGIGGMVGGPVGALVGGGAGYLLDTLLGEKEREAKKRNLERQMRLAAFEQQRVEAHNRAQRNQQQKQFAIGDQRAQRVARIQETQAKMAQTYAALQKKHDNHMNY